MADCIDVPMNSKLLSSSYHRKTPIFSSNSVIIWLDQNLNNTEETCSSTTDDELQQLNGIDHDVKTFTDCDECVNFITDLKNNNQKFILITSIEYIIPLIHDLPQISSIYVFDVRHESKNKQWSSKWQKVKGIFMDKRLLCEKLKRHMRISITVDAGTNDFASLLIADFLHENENNDRNRQEATFMYSRLLYTIFSEVEETIGERNEFIQMCYSTYMNNKPVIDEFARDYDPHRVIWWYTRATMLYSILNNALRTQDIDVLIKMKFFIRDLYQQLKQLHSQASLPLTLTVYRGQGMTRHDFNRYLKENVGGLLSISTFWSTSRDPHVADMFVEQELDKISVLFEITVDTTIEVYNSPFADIHNQSAIEDEDEVLFSIGTTFRIIRVTHLNNDTWKVFLSMTTDDDEQLRQLTNQMCDVISGSTSYHQLGKLMCVMGKWNEALNVYEMLLKQTSKDNKQQLSHIHHQLGFVYDKRADLNRALSHYQQALTYTSSDDSHVSEIYNNIGIIHFQRNHFSQALDYFQKSLDIELRTSHPCQPRIAIRLSNIGGVLKQQGKLKDALNNFERALNIQLTYLAPTHPQLAIVYNNIGTIHFAMKNYSAALVFQQKTAQIQRLSLPPNHPNIATIYCNMATVFEALDEYDQAISHVRQAIDILHHTFEPDHPDVQGVERYLRKLLKNRR